MTLGRLSAAEVCELYGIKPSTWRAYISRGQGPLDIKYPGNPPMWSILDLILWRNIELPTELRIALYSELYRRNARERAWQTRTRLHLIQVGLTYDQAFLFADDCTTTMNVKTFKEAFEVLTERKRFRSRIASVTPVVDDLSRAELNHLISRRVGRVHPNVLMDQLAVLYIARGFDEISPPSELDPRFSSGDTDEFEQMLSECKPVMSLDIDNQDIPGTNTVHLRLKNCN